MDRQEAFGELRALIESPDKGHGWINRVIALLEPVAKAHPEAYRDEWLPYLESQEEVWRRHEKYVSMDRGVKPVACAPFLYYGTELYDASNFPPMRRFKGLKRLQSIDMSDWQDEDCYLDWDWFKRRLVSLRRLNLLNLGLGLREAKSLFAKPSFTELESLIVGGNPLTAEGAEAIAGAGLTKLRELRIDVCGIEDEGMIAIVTSPSMAQLTSLDVGDNDITNEGIQALATSPHMSNLEVLKLNLHSVDSEGLEMIESSTTLGSLRELDVWNYPSLGAQDMEVVERLRARGIEVSC